MKFDFFKFMDVFKYGSWMRIIPSTVVTFYIFYRKDFRKRTILEAGVLLAVYYSLEVFLQMYFMPAFFNYAEGYAESWKYTRDQLYAAVEVIQPLPWVVGFIVGGVVSNIIKILGWCRRTNIV
ncbi:hypothetical protein [Thermincola potens]|uniref:hypothetical protein n=1 Tax=Thermincola potens TaxID=863643 RepID=UPI0018DF5D24|nr:hypothetical protein [Thermincola potens]